MHRGITAIIFAAIIGNMGTASESAIWTGQSSSLAFGSLGGITFSATASDEAPFMNFYHDRFTGDSWQGGLEVPVDARSLLAQPVGANAKHVFRFSDPVEEGLLLIENFDSSSVASVAVSGKDATIELISASDSIAFLADSDAAGSLSTTNPTFDGEGDAVLLFSGAVTDLELNYLRGDGANGVFYGFATPTAQSVPEPTFGICIPAFALLGLIRRTRRRPATTI